MKKYIAFFALIVFAMPVFTFAACGGPSEPPCSALGTVDTVIPGNIGMGPVGGPVYTTDTFVISLLGLVNWFSWFIGLAAVVMGLYSGFLFITGGDNTTQIASARKVMLYAIIGIAVTIISFGLIAISKSILGL